MFLNALLFSVLSFSLLIESTVTHAIPEDDSHLKPRATATNTACALASHSSALFTEASPSASLVEIPAEVAYGCLKSAPNYKEPALALISSLRPWLEIQSDLEYLKDPPIGRLYPRHDIHAALDAIQTKVEEGAYECEYDFQYDIISMARSAHDNHFALPLDLATQVFAFSRGSPGQLASLLVSVSADGLDIPQIYIASDLIQVNDEVTSYIPTTGYTPSPIVSINNQDVVSFLLTSANACTAQDPDTNWNSNFFSISEPLDSTGLCFSNPQFLMEATTRITFANGTTVELPNRGVVTGSLKGVENQFDAYSSFCPNAMIATATSPGPDVPSPEPSGRPEPPQAQPTVFGYPYPAIKHSADMIAGYYLNKTEHDDVAVLRMANFIPATNPNFDASTFRDEFQSVLEEFLAESKQRGKKKLIVDLQRNPGGHIDLGTDFFAQLFPTKPPNSKGNMRASLGMEMLTAIASANVSAAERTTEQQEVIEAEATWVPFAYQSIVKPDLDPFADHREFFGPYTLHGGKFTNFFQANYTDPNYTDYGDMGLIITGTNQRTGFTQTFTAQNMVVLTDGFCGSTCTVVSEYLKSYGGVQFVTVGGRPQTGPMQAVGAVKGSQVFGWDSYLIFKWQTWVAQATRDRRIASLIKNTVWEDWTDVAWQRTTGAQVNARNNFRVGDKSDTPLQYVYEAADCRIWFTREMLYNPVFLWERVAEIAFKDRKGKKFKSQWCIKNSTGHSTSISGGWKEGTLGDQTPPRNARATNEGWQLRGKVVKPIGGDVENSAELKSFRNACSGYSGNKWLFQVICGALMG